MGETADLEEYFEDLYRVHYPRLVAFFGRRGLDPERARELAQETLMRAYVGFRDARPQHPPGWIQKIAINVWRNWVRDHRGTRKRQGRVSSLDARAEEGFDVDEASGGLWPGRPRDAETRAIESQAQARIRSRIEALPPRQRHTLDRWLAGSTYREIADGDGVSIQTVKSTIHKARARIGDDLKAYRSDVPG